jgi:hypothetical protein
MLMDGRTHGNDGGANSKVYHPKNTYMFRNNISTNFFA